MSSSEAEQALRVGLIGAGQHGRYLAPLIKEAGNARLVAAADVSEEARAKAPPDAGRGDARRRCHRAAPSSAA